MRCGEESLGGDCVKVFTQMDRANKMRRDEEGGIISRRTGDNEDEIRSRLPEISESIGSVGMDEVIANNGCQQEGCKKKRKLFKETEGVEDSLWKCCAV